MCSFGIALVIELKYVMRCTIRYHLYNFKNLKNTHGGVLILAATLLKLTLLHRCFSRFLNCTNCIKLRNAPNIYMNTLKCILTNYTSFLFHANLLIHFNDLQCFEAFVRIPENSETNGNND